MHKTWVSFKSCSTFLQKCVFLPQLPQITVFCNFTIFSKLQLLYYKTTWQNCGDMIAMLNMAACTCVFASLALLLGSVQR